MPLDQTHPRPRGDVAINNYYCSTFPLCLFVSLTRHQVEQGAAADRGHGPSRPVSSSFKDGSRKDQGLAAAYRQRLQLFLQV